MKDTTKHIRFFNYTPFLEKTETTVVSTEQIVVVTIPLHGHEHTFLPTAWGESCSNLTRSNEKASPNDLDDSRGSYIGLYNPKAQCGTTVALEAHLWTSREWVQSINKHMGYSHMGYSHHMCGRA